MFKRILLFAAVLLIAIAIAGFVIFRNASQTGSSTLELWIGQQLQAIANSYLNPQLSFDDLDYQYPGTVTLKNMRLVAEDPSGPGKSLDIIGCTSATITLAEIPSTGKPIVIEKIVLDQPLISAIKVNRDSKDFVGFSHLMKSAGPTTGATTGPATGRATKLSDQFQIRLVQINQGRIMYDPRIEGTEPMVLDQINTALSVEPDEAGWFKLSTTIKRNPVFELGVAGQLNLDSMAARDLALKLSANLSPDNLSYLPPQLQKQLKKYEISGDLKARIIGTELPLMHPLQGKLDLDLTLASAHVAISKYHFPVKSLEMEAHLIDGALTVPALKMAALRGTADVNGSVKLDGQYDSQVKGVIAGMMLEDLVTRAEDEPMRTAGKIDANVQLNAPLKVVLAKPHADSTAAAAPLPEQWGSAKVTMVDGRLIDMPVIKQISAVLGGATNIVRSTVNLPAKPSERASVEFELKNDQAVFSSIDYVGELIAMHGSGNISLDKKLDLRINGGPIERVQQLLGKPIGGTMGMITDKLLAYRVTGTLSDPKVAPEIGGDALGNVGRGVQNGAEGVGNTIGRIGEGIGNIIKPKDENK